MTDEFWYLWYEYRAFRFFVVLLLCALIGLLVWLLFLRPHNGDSAANVKAGGGPVPTGEADLSALSRQTRQPVYWAGTMPGTRMELTQTNSGYSYVRYLTGDAHVGDPSPNFLTVATYPTLDAFHDLRSYARNTRGPSVPIAHGGIALTVPGSPTSVFFAYPHEDVQVEVYDPRPKKALDLVKSGVVRPVSGVLPGAAVPAP